MYLISKYKRSLEWLETIPITQFRLFLMPLTSFMKHYI